jgi:hypothetical protein
LIKSDIVDLHQKFWTDLIFVRVGLVYTSLKFTTFIWKFIWLVNTFKMEGRRFLTLSSEVSSVINLQE